MLVYKLVFWVGSSPLASLSAWVTSLTGQVPIIHQKKWCDSCGAKTQNFSSRSGTDTMMHLDICGCWFICHLLRSQVSGSACVLFSLKPEASGTWMNVTQREVCLSVCSVSPRPCGRPLNSFFCVLTQNICSVLLGSVNQTFYYNIIIFLPCPCQRTLNIILEPTPGLFESSVCFLLGVWLPFNRKHIRHV